MTTVKLLVAEKREIVRIGLAKILLEVPEYEVVAMCTCAEGLLEKALELAPDILLMDIEPSDTMCIAKIGELINSQPNSKIIVLTHALTRNIIIEAFRLGVVGYISMDAGVDELTQVIGLVAQGNVVVSSNVADILRKEFDSINGHNQMADTIDHDSLSSREQEVLKLLSQALSTNEIAENLFIAPATVKVHIHNIMEKLEVHTRLQATLEAKRRGLLS